MGMLVKKSWIPVVEVEEGDGGRRRRGGVGALQERNRGR